MQRTHRRARLRLRFGPGTLLALIAAGFLLASQWQARSARTTARYLEADAAGRLRPVERAAPAANPAPPLWKPEPGLLLAQGARLRLTSRQRQAAAAIDRRWRRESAGLRSRMERALPGVPTDGERGVALRDLENGMAPYAELSRLYDARRGLAWAHAEALLTAGQRALLRHRAPAGRGAAR